MKTQNLVATVAAAALFSSGGYAATGSGDGDVVLAALSADGLSTLVWDLSNGPDDLTASYFVGNAGDSSRDFTINVNDLAVPGVADFLAAGIQGWQVFGRAVVGGGRTAKQSVLHTRSESVALPGTTDAPAAALNTATLNSAASAWTTWFSEATNDGLSEGAEPGDVHLYLGTPPNPSADDQAWGRTVLGFSLLEQDGIGASGETLGFWQQIGTSGAADSEFLALGNFKFDVGSGELTYFAVVPVPAAVWMLGSALVGLAGVRRRSVTA